MASALYSARQALDDALPGRFENALNEYDLGSALRKIKATIAAATSSATQDITAIPAAKITINEGPKPVRDSGVLPPIQFVKTLRVSAGAASAGARTITDAGGAASTTVALLSDDDKTLTFESTVTGFVIEYFARPGSVFANNKWTAPDLDATGVAGTDGIGS